ncbi:MAG: ATP synthase F1 subunit epsilon [Polyangia bacterium]|jgi:F-type H+-transporting ATPase subunit epsilon|nr:ATP synthase F1 subunit epsilon [Polyangia bacterium]
MPTFQLRILSLDSTVYDGEVESFVAKGTEGYLGVLAHHAPLITELTEGELTITEEGSKQRVFRLKGGLLEVGHNRATVLADGKVVAGA